MRTSLYTTNKPRLFMGLFLFLLIWAFPHPACPQNQQAPSLPHQLNHFVLTPQSALRGAEGELRSFLGPQRKPLTPIVWSSPSPGVIEYAADHDGCEFHIHTRQITINNATLPIKAALLLVNATNTSPSETQAVFWTAWRHFPIQQKAIHLTNGITLAPQEIDDATEPVKRTPWNPAWVWFFQNKAFVRQDHIVYTVLSHDGWDNEFQVRGQEFPYQALTPKTTLGYRKFEITLAPRQTAALRFLVPYSPLPLNQQNLLLQQKTIN